MHRNEAQTTRKELHLGAPAAGGFFSALKSLPPLVSLDFATLGRAVQGDGFSGAWARDESKHRLGRSKEECY